MISWLIELRHQSIMLRAAVLATAGVLMFAIAGPIAVHCGGSNGLMAASIAAFLCWTGAMSALVAGGTLRGPQQVLFALLAGIFIRMGVPLAFGMAIHLRGGPLVEAGFIYYLLVFYLISLTIETLLSLPAAPRLQEESVSIDNK